MTTRLMDGGFFVVYPDLMKAVGVNRAIILQQIHFWSQNDRDPDVQINTEDGTRWVRVSMKDMAERLADVWSPRSLERYLKELTDAGLLDSDVLNSSPWDQTLSYTVNLEAVRDLQGRVQFPRKEADVTTPQGCAVATPARLRDSSLLEERVEDQRTRDPSTDVVKYVESTTGRFVLPHVASDWKDLVTKWGAAAVTWAIDETLKAKDRPYDKASNPRYVAKVVESYGKNDPVQTRPAVAEEERKVEFRERPDGTPYAVELMKSGGAWIPVN